MKSNTFKFLLILLAAIFCLDPFNFGFVAAYCVTILLLLNFKNTVAEFDRLAFLFLLFSIIYSLFYTFNAEHGTQFIFLYALVPISFYLVGKIIYSYKEKTYSKSLILILMGVFLSIEALLSVGADIVKNGFVTLQRDVPSIWTGELQTATNVASSFALNMSIPAIIILGFSSFKKKFRWVFPIIFFVLSITCVLRLGSRTQLALVIFSIVVALIYKFRKQSAKQNILLFVVIFIIVNLALGYLNLSEDSDAFSAYADRMDSKTHGVGTAGGRLQRWTASIDMMFQKPLGWSVEETGYAHNLWLDATRVGGLISLIILLMISTRFFRATYKLLAGRKSINLLDGQLLIYCVIFALSFFVEPILDGYFILFALFCLMLGFISVHLKSEFNS